MREHTRMRRIGRQGEFNFDSPEELQRILLQSLRKAGFSPATIVMIEIRKEGKLLAGCDSIEDFLRCYSEVMEQHEPGTTFDVNVITKKE